MTPEQKQLVKESWEKVVPIQEAAAEMFYERLFTENPEVKPYFQGDMSEQGRKLMAMISTAVNSLDRLEDLVKPLKRAGKAHAGYGVREEDYDKVGAAFLWTLKQGLKEGFTPEIKDAWTVTYLTVAGVMIDGAEYGDDKTQSEKDSWWKSMLGARKAS